MGENRKSGARYRVGGFREFVGLRATAPTAQLPIIRAVLSTIAYRNWDFRATDVSRAFLNSESLGGEAYCKPP